MSGNGKHRHTTQPPSLYLPSFSVIFFFSLSLPLSFSLTCRLSSVLGSRTLSTLSLFQPSSSRPVWFYSLLCYFLSFFQLQQESCEFDIQKDTGGDVCLHRTGSTIRVNLMTLKSFNNSTRSEAMCQCNWRHRLWKCTVSLVKAWFPKRGKCNLKKTQQQHLKWREYFRQRLNNMVLCKLCKFDMSAVISAAGCNCSVRTLGSEKTRALCQDGSSSETSRLLFVSTRSRHLRIVDTWNVFLLVVKTSNWFCKCFASTR